MAREDSPWPLGTPTEFVRRVFLGDHLGGRSVSARDLQDLVYACPNVETRYKDELWIGLEPLVHDAMTVPVDVLGRWICSLHDHFQDVSEIGYIHWYLMTELVGDGKTCIPIAPHQRVQ